jgi:hypothetical protein
MSTVQGSPAARWLMRRALHLDLDPVIKAKLFQVSAASIDRMLANARVHIDGQRKRRKGSHRPRNRHFRRNRLQCDPQRSEVVLKPACQDQRKMGWVLRACACLHESDFQREGRGQQRCTSREHQQSGRCPGFRCVPLSTQPQCSHSPFRLSLSGRGHQASPGDSSMPCANAPGRRCGKPPFRNNSEGKTDGYPHHNPARIHFIHRPGACSLLRR